MKFILLNSILLFFLHSSYGMNKDSIPDQPKFISMSYELNAIDMFPAQISIGYDITKEIGLNLLIGHLFLTNNSINNQTTYFATSNAVGYTEAGSMIASTKIASSNYLKVSFLKTITSHKNNTYLDLGIFYCYAKSTQELTLHWNQNYYGDYYDIYSRDFIYNIIGLSLKGHSKAKHAPFYFTYGIEIYKPLSLPKPFDDIIPNYYSGNSYIPGQGFGFPLPLRNTIPISFNLGLEFKIPLKKK